MTLLLFSYSSRHIFSFFGRKGVAVFVTLVLCVSEPAWAQMAETDSVGQRVVLRFDLEGSSGGTDSSKKLELIYWPGAMGLRSLGQSGGWCLAYKSVSFPSFLHPGNDDNSLVLESCERFREFRIPGAKFLGGVKSAWQLVSDEGVDSIEPLYFLPPESRLGIDYKLNASGGVSDVNGENIRFDVKGRSDFEESVIEVETFLFAINRYGDRPTTFQYFDKFGRLRNEAKKWLMYDGDEKLIKGISLLNKGASLSDIKTNPASAYSPVASMAYDGVGRIGEIKSYSSSSGNSIERIWVLQYQENGNLIKLTLQGSPVRYDFVYDHLDRLVEVRNAGKSVYSLLYHGESSRVAAWIDAENCIVQFGKVAASDSDAYRTIEQKNCRGEFLYIKDYRISYALGQPRITGVTVTDSKGKVEVNRFQNALRSLD